MKTIKANALIVRVQDHIAPTGDERWFASSEAEANAIVMVVKRGISTHSWVQIDFDGVTATSSRFAFALLSGLDFPGPGMVEVINTHNCVQGILNLTREVIRSRKSSREIDF